MSWTEDLAAGLAQAADAAGVGTFEPSVPIESMTSDQKPIVIGPVQAQPDVQIGITPFNFSADPAMADVIQPVQFWIQGSDRTTVNGIADAIFDWLHGLTNFTLNGIPCPLAVLYSDAEMGVDDAGRRARSVVYDISANRQTASRPD